MSIALMPTSAVVKRPPLCFVVSLAFILGFFLGMLPSDHLGSSGNIRRPGASILEAGRFTAAAPRGSSVN